MNKSTTVLLVCACALAASGALAADDEQKRPVSFEVGTGLEYDSQVAVLELDTSTNAGDLSTLLDFGIGYDRPAKGPFDVSAGYNFSQSLHDDFDEFDLTVHRGSGNLSYDLGRTDVGVNLQYADAALDRAEFMTLEQISPYVSQLVGKRLFLRFAYTHTDKSFAGDPARDAATGSLSGDAYVFLDGLRRYLVLGFRYDDEDAVARQFDFGGYRLGAQLSQRFMAGERELTLKAHLRYEQRDYDAPTPSIGAPRADDRVQIEVSLELPVTNRVTARVGLKHADNRSNLPSVDFDENVASVSFGATF